MECMRCGKEIKGEGVFCPDCLTDMERYPVKPNITVQLPVRPGAAPARKKTRRPRYVKPEDQIRHLKKVRNWLAVLLILTLLALTAVILLALSFGAVEEGFGIGQNYGTVKSAAFGGMFHVKQGITGAYYG